MFKMFKRKQFLLICNFASVLILCNLVCSIDPRLSMSSKKAITDDDLAESTETISPGSPKQSLRAAQSENPYLASWIEESNKQKSSVLPDLNQFLAADDHETVSSSHFKPGAERKSSSMDISINKSRGKKRLLPLDLNEPLPLDYHEETSHDRLVHESASQKEMKRFLELRRMLFDWDKNQEEFLETLGQLPPDPVRERIQDRERLMKLVSIENEAESKRVEALEAAIKENFSEVKRYLDSKDVLELHLEDLLPCLPAGRKIFLMDVSNKSVGNFMIESINKAKEEHQNRKNLLRTSVEKGLRDEPATKDGYTISRLPVVEELLKKEFEDYSRVLLCIFEHASQNYHWDLSEISAPNTWFSSIFLQEISVLSDTLNALQKLQVGDMASAEKYSTEAQRKQESINNMQKKLYSIGLTTGSLRRNSQFMKIQKTFGENSKYLKLRNQFDQVKAKFLPPSTESLESDLKDLAESRKDSETYWKNEAKEDVSIKLSRRECTYPGDPLIRLIKEMVHESLEAFGYELKARVEMVKGNPIQSKCYLGQAYKHQGEVNTITKIWKMAKAFHFDWQEGIEYQMLKDFEKELSRIEAGISEIKIMKDLVKFKELKTIH